MTNENLISVLDLARMELESCYKRLGYSNSNILKGINDSIVHLQSKALSQAAVSGSLPIAVASIRSNFEMWRKGEIKNGAFSWHLQNNLLRIEKELAGNAMDEYKNQEVKLPYELLVTIGEALVFMTGYKGTCVNDEWSEWDESVREKLLKIVIDNG